MVARVRGGQFVSNMTAAATAAALALPPAKVAAQVLWRTGDDTVKAVLSELSRTRPSRGAQLILALDDLEAGRLAQVLGTQEPITVARLLYSVTTLVRRQGLLNRLPWQFRPLVEKHLAAMAESDLPGHLTAEHSHQLCRFTAASRCRRRDTDDHYAVRLTLAYRCSSQGMQTSGTPQDATGVRQPGQGRSAREPVRWQRNGFSIGQRVWFAPPFYQGGEPLPLGAPCRN